MLLQLCLFQNKFLTNMTYLNKPKNIYIVMDDFLPFHYCDDKEFFDLLPVIKSKLKSKISRSSMAQSFLIIHLPITKC